MKWIATKEQPILAMLQEVAQESSKTTLRSWLSEGRIRVGGLTVKDPRKMVYPSTEVELKRKRQYLEEGIELLYQDPHILVVYKPAGLLTILTETDPMHNLHEILKRNFRRRTVHLVHRLDREVSGVMIFAFSEEAQTKLKTQFEEHSILREYLAVVQGNIVASSGTWQSYLQEDANYFVRTTLDPELGKLATTHFSVLQRSENTTTLRVTLETGRKNQIRVHASEAGHPVLGDEKYRSNRFFHGRVALQACKLGIEHPIEKRPLVFIQEPDEEFLPYL
jgi:tRNA pseudouridine32 synthase/23S rRNA pseudouridine746 synthase/23S rRNA pseudouridine1911/1915/1917 synthase